MNKKVSSITETGIFAEKSSLSVQTSSFYKKQLINQLMSIKNAELIINDPFDSFYLGEQAEDNLKATITLNDMECYRDICLGGSNGAAEAYLEGRWTTNDLTKVIQIMARNTHVMDHMEGKAANVAKWFLSMWHYRNKNSKSGSRKNIAAHYDLGNDFFKLFLDNRMMYSSYIYSEGDNLHQASERKLQRICDQLEINEQDHIVEIGSGWGGFACYAAKKTGCKVTTITISQEQYNEAIDLVERENLQGQVFIELTDYRDLTGQYDKLVSIEMIEAVGHHYLDGYFEVISKVLKPGGKALIQAITLNDHRYQQSLKEVDYIKRYIFPGSFIPCVSVIASSAGKNSLIMEGLEDIGLSYAKTLEDWRQRFFNNIDQVKAMGFDDRFIRLWEFYLCYCEGGFLEKTISDVQINFRKAS